MPDVLTDRRPLLQVLLLPLSGAIQKNTVWLLPTAFRCPSYWRVSARLALDPTVTGILVLPGAVVILFMPCRTYSSWSISLITGLFFVHRLHRPGGTDSRPTSTEGITPGAAAKLHNLVWQLFLAGLALASQRNYKSGTNQFLEFCQLAQIKDPFQMTEQFSLFVALVHAKQLVAVTINNYLVAVWGGGVLGRQG